MSKSESVEEKTFNQFIEKLKGGDDAKAKDLLLGEFAEGTDFAGETLLTHVYENSSLDLFMFEAAHFACEQTFEAIKAKLTDYEEEEGCPNVSIADEVYFVLLDELSNIADQTIAEQILNDSVPDLWPIQSMPTCFGVPHRTYEIEYDVGRILFSDLNNMTKLSEDSFEVVLKIEVAVDGRSSLKDSRERLSSEEFGDRSRDPESMTLVYELES